MKTIRSLILLAAIIAAPSVFASAIIGTEDKLTILTKSILLPIDQQYLTRNEFENCWRQ